MDRDELDALEETLDVLQDDELMQDLRDARREIRDGMVSFERPDVDAQPDRRAWPDRPRPPTH
ncbi:hypothetical protein [Cellulomonas sp. PS-H5]|uniref:hypothetical protein n=1 Tax=Cellulomonas sp. PS-H5 TaxID=2820400 RepID=UPI001C4F17A2|nr:hypothetical protein [Cellulomonas sp. PS-H5]MBW0253411.1 hypothetical protein [Cellulomonas sp. PS-H5]